MSAALDLPELKGPVVVELFTSQSCSSCPPADLVLGEMAEHENVIALGCHVTYWDHLSWKDTLSLPACTQRQRAYGAALGLKHIYTPQMVINGHLEFIGANRLEAARAIAQTSGALAPIRLERQGNVLIANLPPFKGGFAQDQGDPDPGHPAPPTRPGPHGPLSLWLAVLGVPHEQSVPSGENAGRTLHYVNPVRALEMAGRWDGRSRTRTFLLPAHALGDDVRSLALLAHTGPGGKIVAAGVWSARRP